MSRTVTGRESGQNQLEYIGLLVLVTIVVATVASSGVGSVVAGRFRSAVCRVMSPGDTPSCGPVRGNGAVPLTPLERATRGEYVALGDSYSSGEGGVGFVPGTDQDVSKWESLQETVEALVPLWDNDMPEGGNMCHRSTKAYAQRVYGAFDFDGELSFYACSGATIEDMLPGQGENLTRVAPSNPHQGEPPQLKHLGEETSLVTLSIGGNDAGFAQVIKECLIRGVLEWQESCQSSMGAITEQRIRNLEEELVTLYNRIQERAPNARVVIVGYPRMFPESPGRVGPSLELGDLDEPIDPADQQWMNAMALLLNQTIKEAADRAGVEFVKVYGALDGHEIGTRYSWINDLDPELENGKPWDMGSFHPNDSGQAAIARLVQRQIRHGDES